MEKTIKPSELKALLAENKNTMISDVRRKADYDTDQRIIPGSVWRDPEQAATWVKEVPKDKETIIYCVRGGSVSSGVIDKLLESGVSAKYIEGGLAAWEADEGELINK